MARQGCEAPSPDTGKATCMRAGKWLVMVGDRKSDATITCGFHLSGVCSAMIYAELPRRAVLSVSAVS